MVPLSCSGLGVHNLLAMGGCGGPSDAGLAGCGSARARIRVRVKLGLPIGVRAFPAPPHGLNPRTASPIQTPGPRRPKPPPDHTLEIPLFKHHGHPPDQTPGRGRCPAFTPAPPTAHLRPRIPRQLQPLPRRLSAPLPAGGLRFHLPAAPFPARHPRHRRGSAAGRGARRCGRRGNGPMVPGLRGGDEGGLKPAGAVLGGEADGGFGAAEEIGEAELRHSQPRGPRRRFRCGPRRGRAKLAALGGNSRELRLRPPAGHVGRNWRHGALKGAALVWPRCCTWGGGWGRAFCLGVGVEGGQSTQLPEQLPAGTPGWRLLLLSRLPNLSAAGLAARAPLRDAVWARGSGAGRSSARFLPPQAVRAGGRSWGRLCSFGAELPRQRGVQRLRGAHLHGHALMALPGYGCSPLAWKAPGRALGPRPQRINAGAALHSSLTLKAGAGHSA